MSGLAAGLSVAGLVSQFRDLAKAMPALAELSRQTGISATELERLKATAANLNIDPSKMTGALQYLSREMVLFHKQSGPLYFEMQNGSSALAEKIRKENPADAYKDVLRWLDAIPAAQKAAGKSAADAAQVQRHYAGMAFGDEDMAQLTAKGMSGYNEAYQQASQDVGQITAEMVKQSEAFDRSISRFDASWNNLKRDLGSTVLPGLTAATDGMRKLFDEVKAEPALLGVGAGAAVGLYARRRIMAGSRLAGGSGAVERAAGRIEGAAVKQSTATTTFAEAVGEFRIAVAELRGKASVPVPVEPVKPGAVETAPKGFLGKGGFKGLGAGLAEGLFGAMVYDYGEKAMDAVLGWTPKHQAALDQATSLSNLAADLKADFFGSGTSTAATGGARQLYSAPAIEEDRLTRARDIGGPPRASAFHPDDDDRQTRARAADAPDRTLDGFVMGALDKPVLHLAGTLKTAAAAIDSNVRPAAFHPAAFGGASSDPQSVIAGGVKEGMLAAMREWSGMSDPSHPGGIMGASFGGGSGSSAAAAGGRRPSLRYGRPHSSAPYDDGGATPTGAHDPLKDLIAQHETGSTGAAGYDTVYGHAERGGPLAPPKPITQMTIAEVLAYQRAMKPRAGSPAFPVGRAQWTESTLRGLTRGMDPSTVLSPDVQEKLFDRSIAGRMGQGNGGLRSEWDSLRAVPDGEIDRAMQGHRDALKNAAPSASASPRGAYPGWMDDKSRRELAGINAPLARDLLAASQSTGAHFRILQGLRTQGEADANARSGRGVRNSQHLYGAAADIRLTDAQGHDLDRSDPAYEKFADAYEGSSRARGGQGRWLGHTRGWSWDRAHFDQGIGYGQSHQRDPYGTGGPSTGDIASGNKEIFSGPDNPFMKAATPLERAAQKLGVAADDQGRAAAIQRRDVLGDRPDRMNIAPMPRVAPEPAREDMAGGGRQSIDPIELNIRHHPQTGRPVVQAKSGAGVKISLRTAPQPVQTA